MAAGPLGLPGYVLPTPWAVATEWFEAASSGRLFVDTYISLYRLLLGAAAGISTGILFGFLVGLSTNARTAFEPIINAMSGIAGIAWIPLALAWFGVGLSMSTFVIWNGMFFVVFANTALGVSRVPASLRESVLTLGGGTSEVLRSVIFPGALPDILTGARSAWRSPGGVCSRPSCSARRKVWGNGSTRPPRFSAPIASSRAASRSRFSACCSSISSSPG